MMLVGSERCWVADEATPIDYAKVVLEAIQQDISRTHVRATAALAIVAAFLTKLDDLQALDGWWQLPKFGGVLFLVVAALCYFQYTQELNKARIKIVKLLPERETNRTELEQVRRPWDRFIGEPIQVPLLGERLLSYHLGQATFVIGSAAIAVVVVKLIS